MALREIIKEGDEQLTKVCRPVTKFDSRLALLLDDMAETVKIAEGCGLAAPQIGVLRRVVVLYFDDEILELVNPEIVKREGAQHEIEGCLSLPGLYFETNRPYTVRVRAFDRNGNQFEVEGDELVARAFCHELDHLDGITIRQSGRLLSEEEVEALRREQEECEDEQD